MSQLRSSPAVQACAPKRAVACQASAMVRTEIRQTWNPVYDVRKFPLFSDRCSCQPTGQQHAPSAILGAPRERLLAESRRCNGFQIPMYDCAKFAHVPDCRTSQLG